MSKEKSNRADGRLFAFFSAAAILFNLLPILSIIGESPTRPFSTVALSYIIFGASFWAIQFLLALRVAMGKSIFGGDEKNFCLRTKVWIWLVVPLYLLYSLFMSAASICTDCAVQLDTSLSGNLYRIPDIIMLFPVFSCIWKYVKRNGDDV